MRYLTTLTFASMAAITGIAFVMEWQEVLAVFAVITVIMIGLPVLNLASNFWFGEAPPQVHVYQHLNDDEAGRLSWLDRRDGKGSPKRVRN